MKSFSVLMSVYYKEKPEYLKECLDSLVNQTVKATEFVIVEDGPLTDGLYGVLDSYENMYPGLIKRIRLERNCGLGLALKAGVPECSYELIARMDSDDICVKDRFEKQLALFDKYPDLDICGSYIKEFDTSVDNVIAVRKVPLSQPEIEKYQKTRSAFNHVTVMFKKNAVLEAGNYEDCPLMEDDMLWVRMLLNNAQGMNIDESLVYVRTGISMIERRGGFDYFKKYKSARKKILDTGYISKFDYYKTIAVQLVVAMMPRSIRLFVFTKLLRR